MNLCDSLSMIERADYTEARRARLRDYNPTTEVTPAQIRTEAERKVDASGVARVFTPQEESK